MITQITKYGRSFIQNEKENLAEVSNTLENQKYTNIQKLKKNYISQKSLPVNQQQAQQQPPQQPQDIPIQLQLQEIQNNIQQLQHSKTEENLKELARKVNVMKVKKNMNAENTLPDDQDYPRKLAIDTLPSELLKKEEIDLIITQKHLQQQQQQAQHQAQIAQKEPEVVIPKVNNLEVADWNAQQYQSLKQSIEKLSFKDIETRSIVKFYSNQIMDYMKRKEKETTPFNALSKHTIPASLRAKMVDWMIEVLSSYKCSEQTFFMSIRLMDLFFAKTTKVHEISDLHLVGVTAMFIACKYEEIYPMKLQVIHEKIAHKKLSQDQIKIKESEMLQTLQFELIGATPYEITMHVLCKSNLNEILERKIYLYLEKICVYLAKMIMYDYELIQQKDYYLLSGALIFVAFKIIEQIDTTFKAEEQIKSVIQILKVQHDTLIETAAKILMLAKTFDKQYPNLDNLKKFNGFSLEENENKKSSLSNK